MKSLSHVWLFVTPWTAAYQAPPSMGFSRQEYWSGVPLPSPHSHLEAHKSQGQDTNSRASVSKDVAPFCQHENWESDIDLFPQSNSFTPEDTILSYFCLIQFSLSLHPHPPVSHRLFSNSTFEPDLTLSYHFSKRISLLLPLNSSNATSWKYSTLMPFHILLLI